MRLHVDKESRDIEKTDTRYQEQPPGQGPSLHRFRGNGVYLLDEPESALSPKRQLSFLARMHDLIQAGSQFLIATHSPILMAYPAAIIYQFSADGVRQVDYEETEHYQITRMFLLRREAMLRELLRDDELDPQ